MKTPWQQIAELDAFRRRYTKDAEGHEHSAENGQFVSTGSGGGSAKSDIEKKHAEIHKRATDAVKKLSEDFDFPPVKEVVFEKGKDPRTGLDASMLYDPNTGRLSINPDQLHYYTDRGDSEQTRKELRGRMLSRLDEQIVENETKLKTTKGKEKTVVKKEIQRLKQVRGEWEISQRFSVGNDAADPLYAGIAHEFGHHMDMELQADITEALRNSTIGPAGGSWQHDIQSLSDYAATNKWELFAEITSAVATGQEHLVSDGLLDAYWRAIDTAKAKQG